MEANMPTLKRKRKDKTRGKGKERTLRANVDAIAKSKKQAGSSMSVLPQLHTG